MLGVIKPQKPPSLADRLRREIDAAADSPAQNKPQPKFNAFSNNETSPPVPAKELQFIDLTTSPFVVPASESATSENAASTTTIPAATPEKEREKIASDPAPSVVSPSKYDDIVSFLSRKGDEPLTKEDAAKLESLIKSKTEGVNIESQKISASPVINPFSQSVALELSDLAPKPPVARLPSPQPKAAQLFQPPADVPMFTFGVSASSAPTASGSLFGSSKPLFAPVFTFSAKASATTSTSSSAVTSRATLTAPSSSSSTLGTRTRRTFRAPGQYTGASFGNTTAAQRRRLAAPTTRTVSSTSSDVPTWSLSSSSNGNGMDISEPISKRHRIDEDALADGNEVGKRRRGNAYGSSEETAVDGEGANGEDSASKLILESLEEMAPPVCWFAFQKRKKIYLTFFSF
ncbi:hypothetical protein BDR26DRAFT_319188 [Obelidium mucronatum]|nr:hypothetical protein BDR26DRAFT_319188 [Obelidium mucronatum]